MLNVLVTRLFCDFNIIAAPFAIPFLISIILFAKYCQSIASRLEYLRSLQSHSMPYTITYTSLSARAYYFRHLPRRLMQRTNSFQPAECAHFVVPNRCYSLSRPPSGCAERFDSVGGKDGKCCVRKKKRKNCNKKQNKRNARREKSTASILPVAFYGRV